MKKLKILLSGILMVGLVAAASIGFIGCGKSSKPKGDFNSVTDVYGFAGMTTSMLFSSQSAGSTNAATSKAFASKNFVVDTTNNEENKDKLEKAFTETLDKYMGVFDAIVGGTKPVDVTTETSDKQEFAHKLTVKVSSLDGHENVCVMYFNETLKADSSYEVDDSDDEDRETILNGEMYFNGSETPLTLYGEKEIDKKSKEVELTFEARIDANNKVVFEQESEVKQEKVEQEYSFELITNGQTTYSFGFEIEKKHNKVEVEYSQNVSGSIIDFEIEKQDNKIVIETEDFFGIELNIYVTTVQDANGQHYVYNVPRLNLTFNGSTTPVVE